MADAIESLKTQLERITSLGHATSLMGWDQETYMPQGGAPSRARALGQVSRIAHEMGTSAEFGRLLEAAEAEGAARGLDPDSDTARLLWWVRRDWEYATKLPAAFVAELRQTHSQATQVWQAARRDNDWPRFAPHLAEVVRLQRQMAAYLGYDAHPYDALLDRYEPEMRTAEVQRIFGELREKTVPLVRAIAERQETVDNSFLYQSFPEAVQWALAEEATALFGYDYQHGRMDRTTHPFCQTIASDDVRITVRVEEDFFSPLFFAALHECGHALYNQGIPDRFEGTPLRRGASAAMHESQSRLWENVVGRGRDFWQGYYPQVQARFPEQLGAVTGEQFYRAINRVEPSLNRVEADEVTYNLHIMLRFDLELALFEGRVEVHELPARWNEKMEEFLGVVPERDAEGVMQDTHWASGLFAYFPTYTLGNVIALQLWEAALAAHPDLPEQIERGELGTVLAWMRANVHEYGRKFLPQELIRRATGRTLDAEPYVRYLYQKFGDIYQLDPVKEN